MAERVFGDATLSDAERDARKLACHLRDEKLLKFNARAVYRRLKREAEPFYAACSVLVDAGIIRDPEDARRDGKPGKKPNNHEVNPILMRR